MDRAVSVASLARTLAASFLVFAALSAAAPSHAAPITLSYAGTIDFLSDPDSLLDPQVTLGASFTVQLTFDPATASLFSSDPQGLALYTTTPNPTLTVSFGGTPLVFSPDLIAIANDQTLFPTSAPDVWTQGYVGGPFPEIGAFIAYEDFSGTKLSSNGFFVPSDSDFSGWTTVRLDFDETTTGRLLASGTIYAVPEPATSLLLAFGLGALAVLRRR